MRAAYAVVALVLVGAPTAAQDRVAITPVTVIDVTDGSVHPEQTVLVAGNRIAAVAPAAQVDVPPDAEVVSGAGGYLIPGLWDMHVHTFSSPRHVRAFFPLFLANGITGVRDTWHYRPVRDEADAAVAARELAGPVRTMVPDNLIDGRPMPNALVANTPKQGRQLVDSLHAAGAPFLKVYSGLTPPTFFAIAERARTLGMPFMGHVPSGVRVADASDAGMRSMEHLYGVLEGCSTEGDSIIAAFGRAMRAAMQGDAAHTIRGAFEERHRRTVATQDEGLCHALADRFTRNETWQVPTLIAKRADVFVDSLAAAGDERVRYVPSWVTHNDWGIPWFPDPDRPPDPDGLLLGTRATWQRQLEVVGMMAGRGVPFLAGSDTPNPWALPGFGLHDELELLVQAGMTPLQALQAATLNPARFFGRTAELGTVEPGKLADLVLLDANPLDDITNTQRIRAVVADGRLYRRAELDDILAGAERAAAGGARAASAAPDLVLLGGRIFTADSTRPWAEALAVSGERITAVGSTSEIAALAGAGTRRIELGGRTVIPGINDAHIHSGVLPGVRVGLEGEDPSFDAVRDSLGALVGRTAPGTWLRASIGPAILLDGMATRYVLDSVAPRHPVMLTSFVGHGTLLNTAALRALGIPESAADPVGGWYRRVAGSRELDGWLHGYADFNARARLAGGVPDSAVTARLREFAGEAARFGITSVQDMPVARMAASARQLRAAELPIRWHLIAFPGTGPEGREAAADPGGPGSPGARVTRAGVKWILEGTPIERGVLMRRPYSDRPGWFGHTYFPADSMSVIVAEAARGNEQLLLHVAGDSTMALVLGAMERTAPDSTWRRLRLRIEHGDYVMPDQLARVRRLGIVIVQNPSHLMLGELFRTRFGARTDSVQPLRSLLEADIPLALGSDGLLNPFLNILFATTHPGRPDEALTREQAVLAYTRGSAFAQRAEQEKGVLAPGFLADIAVLSGDVFTVPDEALPGITSVLTIVSGAIVHGELPPVPASVPPSAGGSR